MPRDKDFLPTFKNECCSTLVYSPMSKMRLYTKIHLHLPGDDKKDANKQFVNCTENLLFCVRFYFGCTVSAVARQLAAA